MDTSSIPKLQDAIMNVWVQDMTPEYFRKLVESMPRRLEAVIDAGGNTTKY